MSSLTWNRNKFDECNILTSECKIYQIIQTYVEVYQLNKDNQFIAQCRTQEECKEIAEFDNKPKRNKDDNPFD